LGRLLFELLSGQVISAQRSVFPDGHSYHSQSRSSHIQYAMGKQPWKSHAGDTTSAPIEKSDRG
ncbi:hypothetical protein ACC719_35010, partial [Rhizobium ruizarguesonis]